MNRIAKFCKVSFEQFVVDMNKIGFLDVDRLREIYDNIQLPTRKTKRAAGYDFIAPYPFVVDKNETVLIPTGIRCEIEGDWFLNILPRSGQGFKNHVRLANTCGVIDADYFGAPNEGHIMVKLINGDVSKLSVNAGDGFAQGIFLPFGVTVDDENDDKMDRVGGFGSTSVSQTY